MFNIVNNQFQKFYEFAQARKSEGKNTAIAKLGDDVPANPLAERSIVVKEGDFIGKFRFPAKRCPISRSPVSPRNRWISKRSIPSKDVVVRMCAI